jgi:ADP-ribose pyrophosphatase YjhB (NUDIX family)
MTDVTTGPAPGGPEPVAAQTARMSPVSRLVNVFFSPGAVFDDVRRDPRGWLTVVLIIAAFVTIANMLYLARFAPFQGDIVATALKENVFMKMAPPEIQDKTVQDTIKMVNAIPLWQLELQQVSSIPVLKILQTWFFTFLYTLLALAMGWLLGVRIGKVFLSLAIVCGVMVVTAVASGVLQGMAKSATLAGGTSPAWIAIVGLLIGGGAAALIVLAARMLAAQGEVARILAVVALAMAPLVLWAIACIIISFIKTPDPTSVDELVPSSVGLLMGMKDGALGGLLGELDIFRLWILSLATIGLSRVFKKSFGAAAVIVFTPWILWVVCVVAIGAIGSMSS